MCRYTCCGCYWGSIHSVRNYELMECDNYILIDVSSPTANDGQFFCVRFKNIPTSSTSYPLYININDEEIPIQTRGGRQLTSADLSYCMILSGMYTNGKYIVC